MCLIVEPSMEIVPVIGSLLGAPEVPRALRKRRERWLNGTMMKAQILHLLRCPTMVVLVIH